ncbi:MAG: hypothetical protein ACU0CA_11775 [Paracoccaceae bacterium]
MPISQQLDTFREAFPACSLIGLVDVSSGIVLCVSTEKKPPQEQLDSICASATQLFNSSSSKAFSNALGGTQTAGLNEAIVMNTTNTCLFLRSPVDSMEAMFCLCAPQIDIDNAMSSARTTLNRIATE